MNGDGAADDDMTGMMRAVMRLIESADVVLTPLITKRMPLDGFFEALDAATRGEGLKTVVVPSSDTFA